MSSCRFLKNLKYAFADLHLASVGIVGRFVRGHAELLCLVTFASCMRRFIITAS